MTRRIASKVALALAIVLIISLTTVRARQAWGEQQARSSFDAARHGAVVALQRGVELGLRPSELRPLQSSLTRLDAIPSPAASIFWGSQETFYNRRARAYRSLTLAIHREIERVRIVTRIQADRAIAGLSAELTRARTYDLVVDRSAQQLGWARRSFTAASSPKQYRSLTRATEGATTHLHARIAWQAGRVSGVLSAGGNTLPGVLQAGDNDASAARDKLSLVSLFTSEGKPLDAELGRIASSMHGQRTALGAAVKELDLRDLIARITAMSARVVPAKLIVVSTEDQWAHMYQNGTAVYETAVTTGGPELPTDHGTFHIYEKISPFVFHSPWPPGSPYYYPPTPVDFWMPFDGGEGLHDASWRSNFGPGSNLAPTDLGTGNYILGTHGCVNLPYDAASFVWNWAPIGTTVVVV